MTDTAPRANGRFAHILFGANAVIALTGLVVGFALTLLGTYPSTNTNPTLLGNPEQGVIGRVLDYFTYFTIWSNIVVAVVAIMLFVRPDRDSFWFRAVRLSSLLMITVTGIIYNVVLAATADPQGWEQVSNAFDHVLTPIFTVLVWLLVGPRGWFSWRIIAGSLVIPIVWLAWALARGAVINAYPYGFLDAATNGYATVATNVLGIVVFALVLGLVLWGIDAVIRKASGSRSAA